MSGTWWTKIHQEGLAKWWKEPQPFSSLPADWILSSSHLLSFFNKVFPADVSHDPRCQSVPHHIHHGPEAIPEYSSTKDKHSFFFCWHLDVLYLVTTERQQAQLLRKERICCFQKKVTVSAAFFSVWFTLNKSFYSQSPVDGNDESDVIGGQAHRGQYDHHGNKASLWDSSCADAGSRGSDAKKREKKLIGHTARRCVP